jgi:D-alanyl-D-alanine carboxypeptidase (penicillin-binding protein 5/6)
VPPKDHPQKGGARVIDGQDPLVLTNIVCTHKMLNKSVRLNYVNRIKKGESRMHAYPQKVNSKKRRQRSLVGMMLFTLIFLVSNAFAERIYSIHSRSVAVIDGSTGEILYAKNPEYLSPPASTAKLMTAIVTVERANLSDIVTISPKASHVHASKVDLKKGNKITIEALLYAALLKSANNAAVALAEAVAGTEDAFVVLMNQKTTSIGANNTEFTNATGLPGPGQHTTALDLTKIMRYSLTFPKIREILGTPAAEISTEEGKIMFLRNTDELLRSDGELIGGKTGFTGSARHCFVCAAERDKKMIIACLLGSPSRKNLWQETQNLLNKGFQRMGESQPGF